MDDIGVTPSLIAELGLPEGADVSAEARATLLLVQTVRASAHGLEEATVRLGEKVDKLAASIDGVREEANIIWRAIEGLPEHI